MRVLNLSLAVLLLGGVVGCGTTQIITNDPTARIFADGRMIGQGQASIVQRGAPGSTAILVKSDDGRRQETVTSRRFTATTLLTGLLTYGICLIACWEYPDAVFVPLPESPRGHTAAPDPASTASVAGTPGDPWLAPPPGWRAKPRTGAPAEASGGTQ